MGQSERTRIKSCKKELKAVEATRSDVEKNCMFDGKDPTDKICEGLKSKYTESLGVLQSAVKETNRNVYKKAVSFLPRKSDDDAEGGSMNYVTGSLRRIHTSYRQSRITRKSFYLISDLAYMEKPPEALLDAYSHLPATEWDIKFNKLTIPDVTAWDVLGYSDAQFQTWWETRQRIAEMHSSVRQEWKDMKALYSGMVILLDYLVTLASIPSSIRDELSVLEKRIKDVGVRLYQGFGYPEHFSFMSELFGYVAPFIYVASNCMSAMYEATQEKAFVSNPVEIDMAFEYYKRKVLCLGAISKALLERLEHLIRLTSQTHASAAGQMTHEHQFVAHAENKPDASEVLKSFAKLTFDDKKYIMALKNFGLEEIRLSSSEGSQLGFGSSSLVLKRSVPGGRGTCYAVKQPQGKSAGLIDDIWNRVGREAEIWTPLKHDNIVQLRGFAILPGNIPALAMDVCRSSLPEFIVREAPIVEKRRLELILGISKAISYLHARGIAHGDLRASNFLVTEDAGKAMLTDFGTAYYVDKDLKRSCSPSVFESTPDQVGNPAWLAPELLEKILTRDREADIDSFKPCISIPGDIYSFGCALLEVLYERNPYHACQSEDEMKTMKMAGVPPATLEQTSTTFFSLLESMWHSDPGLRISAVSVTDRLDNILNSC